MLLLLRRGMPGGVDAALGNGGVIAVARGVSTLLDGFEGGGGFEVGVVGWVVGCVEIVARVVGVATGR